MILIDICGLSVNIGEKTILSDISLQIQKGQCVGLTGDNGAGKTTLMKALVGQAEYTGIIRMAKGLRIGYLAQIHESKSETTVIEEAKKSFDELFDAENELHKIEEEMTEENADMAALGERYQRAQDRFESLGGYGWNSRLTGVLKGLGLTEKYWDMPVKNLSGGERTRLALAGMLLKNYDVLLLDEPTNHLDLQAAQWLTDYLARFSGTVLLISHDRYMMDKLCSGVARIENKKLRYYNGNYTDYCFKWAEELKAEQKAYDKQQDEIRRQKAIIARFRQFNREKSIRAAESREKVLAKMDLLEAPEEHDEMRLSFNIARQSGGDVFTLRDIGKSFENKRLFSHFSTVVKKGERIVIIGDNGAGKTTLTEIISGRQSPSEGNVTRGVNVDIGYYEQNHRDLMGDESVMDMVWQGDRDLTQTQVRSRCAAMLFFGDDVFKPGRVLSGGERARCALARLSVAKNNTLLMDEPTNHLDMDSREVLEDALSRFDGTIIAVSHDRYFINRIATKLWIVKDGAVEVFEGTYDDYVLAQKPQNAEDSAPEINKTQAAKQRAKDRAAKDEEKKKKIRLRELEKEIELLEKRIGEIEEQFAGSFSDKDKMLELQREYNSVKDRLEQAENEWMEASE